jgi:hypothetical protein
MVIIGKTFCQVWTDHKLVNTTQKLQFGVMVTEKSFWDKKLPLFVESPIYLNIRMFKGCIRMSDGISLYIFIYFGNYN